ncbi:hypothetical protein Salat_1978400 [Sesamum alatum]|uniref:Uncharacterized protein n=1 Tax=Sesamum alatum TaxID=300844 RepID=A0AAE1Y579_9LAMI|nr:hypothetical protein Salat_1978400 [Sesamum alatum]
MVLVSLRLLLIPHLLAYFPALGAWVPRPFFLPRPRYLRSRHSLLGSLVCSSLVILPPDPSGYGLVTFFVLLVRPSLIIIPPDPRRHSFVVSSSYSLYARASSPYLLILAGMASPPLLGIPRMSEPRHPSF